MYFDISEKDEASKWKFENLDVYILLAVVFLPSSTTVQRLIKSDDTVHALLSNL